MAFSRRFGPDGNHMCVGKPSELFTLVNMWFGQGFLTL